MPFATGPVENYNGTAKPPAGDKMPIKHFESATKVATPKTHITVDSPCEGYKEK